METFIKLFGSLLGLVYHCFDRIVVQGYLPLLTRQGHTVHFFGDVHGIIAIQWPDPDMKKKDMNTRRWMERTA
jgi:hypothetical protein